jgi:hypothetical protein
MSKNPLFDHLTQDSKWPSLRVAIWLAGALALLSLGDGIYDLWNILHGVEPGEYSSILAFFAWPLAVIFPPFVALIAALQTGRDAANPESPMRRLSEKQIVRGYVMAALHRLRVPLAVLVGISPLLTLGMLNFALTGLVSQAFANPCVDPITGFYAFRCYTPVALDVVGPLVEMLLVVAGMLALSLLAAAAGVMLALWWRRSTQTVAFLLPAVMLVGGLFGILVMLSMLGPTISGRGFSQLPHPLLDLALPLGACVIPPTLLTLGAVAWARHQASSRLADS